MTNPLTQRERATLSDADRAMLDDAVQAIPSEHDALFTALLLSTRAIVRHDVAGVRTAAEGYAELLDVADERARELLDAAHELQAAATSAQHRNEERLTRIEVQLDAKAQRDRRADLFQSLTNVFVGIILLRSLYVMLATWQGLSTTAALFILLGAAWGVIIWRWWQQGRGEAA
jgi:Flp pilus assembly protein TadB